MKKLILASAVMLAMTGCFESEDFACNVVVSDTSVKMVHSYKDYKEEETATLKRDDYGYYTDIVNKTTYPTRAAADNACEDADDDYYDDREYTERPVCEGRSVTTYDERSGNRLEDKQYEYESQCRAARQAFDNGSYEAMYKAAFGL